MGLNKAMVIGNVGKNPEVRKIGDNGNSVCNFSLATNDRRFKDADGKPRTEWHNIVAWGKLADIIGQYVTKGMTLYLEGRLQTRRWEDKDGRERWTTEIVADQMEMLGGGSGSGQGSQADPQQAAPSQGNQDSYPNDPGF